MDVLVKVLGFVLDHWESVLVVIMLILAPLIKRYRYLGSVIRIAQAAWYQTEREDLPGLDKIRPYMAAFFARYEKQFGPQVPPPDVQALAMREAAKLAAANPTQRRIEQLADPKSQPASGSAA